MKMRLSSSKLMKSMVVPLCGFLLSQTATAEPNNDTGQESVADILAAAPESVARQATVISRDGKVLRKGEGEWVCRIAGPSGNDPVCTDSEFRAYLDARTKGKLPTIERIGLAYMLQGMSWDGMYIPPHGMLIVPDNAYFQGFPTVPSGGTPWVMMAETPYAHLVVPMGEGLPHKTQ
ncbi:hypothetical protein [Henriciella sp.]|uniref:hypothetical protein n=1 Tax=Henriciella sp. TaxID=1968823 RepID=UPI00262FBFB2|nr:hypothetical protein [Henriciella sp.]